jgi:hypothetical protein
MNVRKRREKLRADSSDYNVPIMSPQPGRNRAATLPLAGTSTNVVALSSDRREGDRFAFCSIVKAALWLIAA